MNVISMQRSQRILLAAIIAATIIIIYVGYSQYVAKLSLLTMYSLMECYCD